MKRYLQGIEEPTGEGDQLCQEELVTAFLR
jgi:hypothetical protein